MTLALKKKRFWWLLAFLFAGPFLPGAPAQIRPDSPIDYKILPQRESNNNVYDSLFKANDWRVKQKELKNRLGEDWIKKSLSVGCKMPDLILNNLLFGGDSIRISDFRGKLIILDFWNSGCYPCIASMPHMKEIQAVFRDKIQVIFINPFESKFEIEQRVKRSGNLSEGTKMLFDSASQGELLFVTEGKEFYSLFPTCFYPQHVWIDDNGVVIGIGSPLNSQKEKIKKYLNGDSISFLGSESNLPSFTKELAYHKIVGDKTTVTGRISFFDVFNPFYAPTTGGQVANYIDTVSKLRRSTFINKTVTNLYQAAFSDLIREYRKKMIFAPNPHDIYYQLRDTSICTDYFIDPVKKTDLDFIKSRYCYEQFSDLALPTQLVSERMANDLNYFFGKKLGIKGELRATMQRVYCLVEIDKKIASKIEHKLREEQEYSEIVIEGQPMIKSTGYFLSDIITRMFDENSISELKRHYFINGITNEKRVNIIMPNSKLSLLEVRKIIRRIGFDIIRVDEKVLSIYISDK